MGKNDSGSLTGVEVPTQSMHYISSASKSHEEPATLSDDIRLFCCIPSIIS